MAQEKEHSGYLPGHLLVAMPQMSDPRFARSVVFLCAHSADGAMGLVVNKIVGSVKFNELLRQFDIDAPTGGDAMEVYFGGPVESGRGFVLHTPDYEAEGTMRVDDRFALTASLDILRSIASGKGPAKALLALGYAGWAGGQLDGEIQANGWLNVPADHELVFGHDNDHKWSQAAAKVGIDLSLLSSAAGHA